MKQFLLVLSMVLGTLFCANLFAVSNDTNTNILSMEKKLKEHPENYDLLFGLGQIYYNQAMKGDKNSTDKALDCFEKASKLNQKKGMPLCWLGSIYTIKGRDAMLPLMKMTYVNKGITLMADAVNLEPGNISLRMIRGSNLLCLPEIFKQLDIAISDFNTIVNLKEEKHYPIPENVYAQALENLEISYRKKGKADLAESVHKKLLTIKNTKKAGK